jgi:hypothetical protein
MNRIDETVDKYTQTREQIIEGFMGDIGKTIATKVGNKFLDKAADMTAHLMANTGATPTEVYMKFLDMPADKQKNLKMAFDRYVGKNSNPQMTALVGAINKGMK